MERTSSQKAQVFMAWRLVTSALKFLFVASSTDVFSLALGDAKSPSGSSPILSGERFNWKLKGRHTSKNMQPEAKAAQRQPMEATPMAKSGEISAPPIGTAALTTVMARARWRINQLFATTNGE